MFLVSAVNQVKSTHIVGGVLTYVHNGGLSYTVTLKLYRDCNATVNLPGTVAIAVTGYNGLVFAPSKNFNINLTSSSFLPSNLDTCAQATDLNFGVLAGYNFSSKTNVTYRGIFGASYRNKDAVIIHAGINKANQILRLSYDINVSPLKSYTRSRGAFEISLILTAKRGEPILKGISSF